MKKCFFPAYHMMRCPLILLLALFFCITVSAQEKAGGDAAYRSGNYKKAVEYYRNSLKKGEASAVYYNMGNAYYRMADYPNAMLSYLKAQKLSPADDDIQHNIEITSSKTIDRIPVDADVIFVRWYKSLVFLFSINTWALISILSLALSLVAFLIYLFVNSLMIKRFSFYGSCVLFIVFLLSFLFAYQQRSSLMSHDKGVVTTEAITVKSSPTTKASDVLVIHEGTVIEITDNDIPQWLGIKLSDGSHGWIPSSSVEVI